MKRFHLPFPFPFPFPCATRFGTSSKPRKKAVRKKLRGSTCDLRGLKYRVVYTVAYRTYPFLGNGTYPTGYISSVLSTCSKNQGSFASSLTPWLKRMKNKFSTENDLLVVDSYLFYIRLLGIMVITKKKEIKYKMKKRYKYAILSISFPHESTKPIKIVVSRVVVLNLDEYAISLAAGRIMKPLSKRASEILPPWFNRTRISHLCPRFGGCRRA